MSRYTPEYPKPLFKTVTPPSRNNFRSPDEYHQAVERYESLASIGAAAYAHSPKEEDFLISAGFTLNYIPLDYPRYLHKEDGPDVLVQNKQEETEQLAKGYSREVHAENTHYEALHVAQNSKDEKAAVQETVDKAGTLALELLSQQKENAALAKQVSELSAAVQQLLDSSNKPTRRSN